MHLWLDSIRSDRRSRLPFLFTQTFDQCDSLFAHTLTPIIAVVRQISFFSHPIFLIQCDISRQRKTIFAHCLLHAAYIRIKWQFQSPRHRKQIHLICMKWMVHPSHAHTYPHTRATPHTNHLPNDDDKHQIMRWTTTGTSHRAIYSPHITHTTIWKSIQCRMSLPFSRYR